MKRPTRLSLFSLAVLAGLTIVPGCGSGRRPTGTVSGKVTLRGQPLAAGTVQFANEKLGAGASAVLNTAGTYRVEAPLPTGQYEVTILPPPPPAPHEMDKAASLPRSNIPIKFQDPKTSGLTATIQEGANTADFAL